MNKREIRFIEKTLLKYGKGGNVVRVLEWGSGGSTVHFTKFMQNHGVHYLWRSIEYNKGWYEKIEEAVKNDSHVKITLFNVGNNVLRQRYVNMDQYVDYPKTLNEKFDVIIVDGRKRRRCLIEASTLVDSAGVVFLHDAQRKHYQCAFPNYTNHTFVSMFLWRGDRQSVSFFKKTYNKVRSLLLKIMYRLMVRPSQLILGHLKLKYKLTKEVVSQGGDLIDKIKILLVVFLLALKKRNLIFFNFKTTLKLKNTKSVNVSLSAYKDASHFHQDILENV